MSNKRTTPWQENMEDDTQSEGSSQAEDAVEVLNDKLDEILDRLDELTRLLKPNTSPITVPPKQSTQPAQYKH